MIPYAVIIQARMGSERRPGKVACEILERPMLHHQLKRLHAGVNLPVFVATTTESADDAVAEVCAASDVQVHRGSVEDVLARYLEAAEKFEVENIIRVGGDDPLIDPACIDALVAEHRRDPVDFLYASHKYGWIYGTAAELVSTDALRLAFVQSVTKEDREHVVSFVRKSGAFSSRQVVPADRSLIRPEIFLSVDYQQDVDLVKQVLEHFSSEDRLYTFTQSDLVELYDSGRLDITNRHLHDGFEKS